MEPETLGESHHLLYAYCTRITNISIERYTIVRVRLLYKNLIKNGINNMFILCAVYLLLAVAGVGGYDLTEGVLLEKQFDMIMSQITEEGEMVSIVY